MWMRWPLVVSSNVRKAGLEIGLLLAPAEVSGPLYREVHVGWTHGPDCATLRGCPGVFEQRWPWEAIFGP